jgi:hypothetical protein
MYLVRTLLISFFFLAGAQMVHAQDTLPRFTVKNRFGKVIVSWINPYDSVVQISIQRSPDSLKGFKTIATLPDPNVRANGYLDSKAPNTTQFYKIYVQQTRGRYLVTKAQKPIVDSSRITAAPASPKQAIKYTAADTAQWIKMEMAGVTRQGFKYVDGKNVIDSTTVQMQEIKNSFRPSVHIYTNREGNVVIALPEVKTSQYSIRFFLENGMEILQLNKVKEPLLTLDKSNFLHAGWFRFELYENDVLKEKNKFYLPKDRQ